MSTYGVQIGAEFSDYSGDSPQEAVATMYRDAGYNSSVAPYDPDGHEAVYTDAPTAPTEVVCETQGERDREIVVVYPEDALE